MAGTNITRAGTNIMTRNEYYRILTFRPERFLPGTNIMRHRTIFSVRVFSFTLLFMTIVTMIMVVSMIWILRIIFLEITPNCTCSNTYCYNGILISFPFWVRDCYFLIFIWQSPPKHCLDLFLKQPQFNNLNFFKGDKWDILQSNSINASNSCRIASLRFVGLPSFTLNLMLDYRVQECINKIVLWPSCILYRPA